MSKNNFNQVCQNCLNYIKGECHHEPPALRGDILIDVSLPQFCAQRETVTFRVTPDGPFRTKLERKGGWPPVDATDWCSKWTDGTCEFCGSKPN
jgi:hypothetical protein